MLYQRENGWAVGDERERRTPPHRPGGEAVQACGGVASGQGYDYLPMLKASCRWNPSRSATTNAQAIMIGARFTTTNLVFSTLRKRTRQPMYPCAFVFDQGNTRPCNLGNSDPWMRHGAQGKDPPAQSSNGHGRRTHLFIEHLIKLEAADALLFELVPRAVRQELVSILIPFAFPLHLSSGRLIFTMRRVLWSRMFSKFVRNACFTYCPSSFHILTDTSGRALLVLALLELASFVEGTALVRLVLMEDGL